MSLGFMPKRALLNDVNPHLINFYDQIRKGLHVETDLINDEQTYYQYRAEFNTLARSGAHTTQKAAELFYYLNRTGFNGLCRFNQKGEFNVPKGSYKKIEYVRNFDALQKVFKQWRFSAQDFEDLVLLRDDFVYADPPYDVPFTTYSQDGFSWDDQVRTAAWLAKHTGPVLLSNQATPRILELYASLGYTINLLDAPRRISCNGDRTKAKEVLATRNI